MQSYAACIEYDGIKYSGFQKQENAVTVQDELERALSQIAAEPILIQAAGRTDRHVHATHQVVHFSSTSKRPEKAWVQGVNTALPSSIRVIWCVPVEPDFHARFSALSRRYCYLLSDATVKPCIAASYISHTRYKLNAEKMQSVVDCFLGERDFSALQASGCQSKTPNRLMLDLQVKRRADVIAIEVEANAFLYHMVRNLVGVLIEVGSGRRDKAGVQDLLNAKTRCHGAITAPATGLYLVGVRYGVELPSQIRMPWLWQMY